MPAGISAYNLVQLIVDLTSKKLLANLVSTSPRTSALTFTKGDTVRGEVRVVYQTGVTAAPLQRIYPLPITNVKIQLTDGISVMYVDATAIAYETTATNGSTDGRLGFTFDITSAAIDAAFALAPTDQFINAFLEARITLPSVSGVGGPGSITQDEIVIKESCQINKTAIT